MPRIHPSATISGDVSMADDVQVGPGCFITGPVTIGPGCILIANACLQGPLTMGERNVLYPGACLGFAPQDLGFDPNQPGAGLVIGSRNTFREGVNIHRAKTPQPTRIGDDNYFMAYSHMAHDAVMGNRCVLANGALVAGHVQVADRVIFGGNVAIHQFVRIGRGCMLSGAMATGLDIPPFFVLTGMNLCGAVNLVGMRRAGMTSAQIDVVRWAYRILMRSGLPRKAALEALRERADDPLVAEYVAFVEGTKRGLCHGNPRAIRSGGAMAAETADREA